jgi:hypothetical protein
MKAIRWLLFVPLCILVLALIQYSLGLLLVGVASMHLSVFWLIVGLFFVGGFLWGMFKMVSMGISMLTVFFCPDRKVGGYILSILTFIGFLYSIIRLWSIQEDLKGDIIVICLVMTVLYIQLGFMIIFASLTTDED